MLALVVYESVHGATARAARTIGMRLQTAGMYVDLRHLPDLAPPAAAAADLLVVGGPTHLHGMSWTLTRRVAAAASDLTRGTVGPGLRTWFHRLPHVRGPYAAAFDTRRETLDPAAGTAAEQIADRLDRHGYLLVGDPTGFLVRPDHSLVPGELERAGAWADGLVAAVQSSRY